jgi:crotonobetainyl-CoA:carnitine CoA-transferase CaiB-like acyl-CoA transferase
MSALNGLRIVDLSRHAPGPYCTMLLADLGADVIVVEQPAGEGRQVSEELGVSRKAKIFNPVGRNKRSIALNLKNEAMKSACLKLIEGADIVVEGFRPGVAKRLGLDYESIIKINPEVIYCSISGYGQTGPYRDFVGHDLNYISIGGVLGMTGNKGGAPVIPPNVVGDYAGGGLMAAFSILAAVVSKKTTGKGQYIDIAMSDGVLSLANLGVCDYLSSGTPPRPGEYFLTGSLPCYNVYETADKKWLSIGNMEPWFWAKLCKRLGCEEFANKQFDEKQFEAMFTFLRAAFKQKTRDVWFAELSQDEICVTPVLGMEETLTDPHNIARNMVVELHDPELGTVKQVGIAPKFSGTPGAVRTLPPDPGQHSREILREAGYSNEEISKILT